MENKIIYKCAVCGKEYEKLSDRIACETACLKKREEDEAKRKQLELQEKKSERYDEVQKAYETYKKLLNAYVKDYEPFPYPGSDCYWAELFNDLFSL